MDLKKLLIVMSLLGFVTGCGGGSNPPDTNTLLSGAALSAELERFRAENGFPGLAVVLIDDARTEVAVSGQRRIGMSDPIQTNDLFQVGSLNKAQTATMIARLVEQKKLRWDSTLSEVFPAWRSRIRPEFLDVTLQQLLQHRSGIQIINSAADADELLPQLTGDVVSDRQLLGLWLLQQPPRFQPGSKSEYSNTGYDLAGLMASTVTGLTYEDVLTREVLAPLHMQASFSYPEQTGPGTPAAHIFVNGQWQTKQFAPEELYVWRLEAAAGGVSVSLPDYAHFLRAHLDGLRGQSSYLPSAAFQFMHTPIDEFGLGWREIDWPIVGKISAHAGAVNGYYVTNRVVPSQNRAIAVACNCDASASERIEMFANRLLKLVP